MNSTDYDKSFDKIETKNINEESKTPLNEMFYDKGSNAPTNKSKLPELDSKAIEFVGKSSNRKLDPSIKYNIHFTLDSGTFLNMINFLSDIEYNVAFCFKKKEVYMVSIESGNSHGGFVKINNIDFTDYSANIGNEVEEKWILIDTTPITDRMMINEEKPVDMYVDTVEKNRFYIVNGKEYIARQLNTTASSDGPESLVKKHKGFENTLTRLMSNEEYQKVIVNSVPLTNVMKSLLKKTDKSKDVTTLCTLNLTKYKIDWKIVNEVEENGIALSGDDIVVCPLHDDVFKFSLKFFNKFGKMKTTNTVEMFVKGDYPIVLNTKIGNGSIKVWFLLAPRIDDQQ